MSPEESFLESMWQGWEKIFSKDQMFKISDYSNMYGKVFTYFTSQPNNCLNAWKLISRQFFERLGEFLRKRVHHIFTVGEDERDDGDVVRFYAREWNEYKSKAKILDAVCIRAYRLYCNKKNPELSEIIYKLAVTSWRDHQFRTRVVKAVLNLIERERNGDELPDIHLIKDVLNCFTEDAGNIDLDDVTLIWSSPADELRVYRDTFESQFLRDTEIFYASKCPAEFSNLNGSCTEYIKFVERTLRIENDRVRMHLPESTGEKSMFICRAELMMTKPSDNDGSQSETTPVKRRRVQVSAEVVSTIGKFIDSLFTEWGIQEEKSSLPT